LTLTKTEYKKNGVLRIGRGKKERGLLPDLEQTAQGWTEH